MKKSITGIGGDFEPEVSGADPAEGIARFFGVTESPVPHSLEIGPEHNAGEWEEQPFPPGERANE